MELIIIIIIIIIIIAAEYNIEHPILRADIRASCCSPHCTHIRLDHAYAQQYCQAPNNVHAVDSRRTLTPPDGW